MGVVYQDSCDAMENITVSISVMKIIATKPVKQMNLNVRAIITAFQIFGFVTVSLDFLKVEFEFRKFENT